MKAENGGHKRANGHKDEGHDEHEEDNGSVSSSVCISDGKALCMPWYAQDQTLHKLEYCNMQNIVVYCV